MIQLPFPSLTADDPTLPLAVQVQANLEALMLAVDSLTGLLYVGSGSPETAVVASPPAIYLNRSGGASTTLYVKTSGSATNTGWTAK